MQHVKQRKKATEMRERERGGGKGGRGSDNAINLMLIVCLKWMNGKKKGRRAKESKWRFRLVSLFNGISTYVGYLMPEPFS